MNAMLRRLRQIVSIVLVLLAAVWVTGEASQWLLRRHAEKLLAEIRALEVGRSGWQDAQQMIGKWGRSGAPTGACTAEKCTYRIDLLQTLPQMLEGYPGGGAANWLPRALGRLGLRSAAVRAGFTVENGIVTEKWFGEQVTLPVRDWGRSGNYVPFLSASSRATAKFHDRTRDPDQAFPNRLVRAYPYGLSATFSPEEDASEQALLMDFRFSCITQRTPCVDASAILPEASRTLQQERQQLQTR